MKKELGVLVLICLFLMSGMVSAINYAGGFVPNYINVVNSQVLVSGNGICEEYNKTFSTIGEKQTVSINGISFEIEYTGMYSDSTSTDKYPSWKVNGLTDPSSSSGNINNIIWSNNLNNGDKFMIDANTIYGSDGQQKMGGSIFVRERNYYPQDCVGIIKEQYADVLVMGTNITRTGWYLVSGLMRVQDCYYANKNLLCKEDVLAEYYYSPLENKYYEYKDVEEKFETKYNDTALDEQEKYLQQMMLSRVNKEEKYWKFSDFSFLPSMFRTGDPFLNFIILIEELFSESGSKWIYVGESGVGKMITGERGIYNPTDSELNKVGITMFKGWNHLGISDSLIDKKLSEVVGDCNIEKVYSWSSVDQKWIQISDRDYIFRNDYSLQGNGYVIKVIEDCRLGINTLQAVPPIMPN